MIKVLHITPWFPTHQKPFAALWIKRHIEALSAHCLNTVWHISASPESGFSHHWKNSNQLFSWNIGLKTERWFIIELITLIQLFTLGIFKRKTILNADIINFHIAYPSLIYWPILRSLYNQKIVITEHWSAYHFNFGVKGNLPRAQRVFKFGFPLITVSNALKQDIELFSGKIQNGIIIPNIVDSEQFYYQNLPHSGAPIFFMVSLWKFPKDPISVIKEFQKFLIAEPDAQLRIAGYGPLVDDITEYIFSQNLTEKIAFLGILKSDEIAHELNMATAFIHLSTYETFSVVCAEAICCGCPVIASDVGGISEFINDENGLLVSSKGELINAMTMLNERKFNREVIAKNAKLKFSNERVGSMYFNYLQDLI